MIWANCADSDRNDIRKRLAVLGAPDTLRSINLAKRIRKAISGIEPDAYVYFIQNDIFCKVGYSERPRSRFIALRHSSPHDCYLLGFIPGGLKTEQTIHEVLSDRHHRNEWFHLDKTLQLAAMILCFGHQNQVIPGDTGHRHSPNSLFYRKRSWEEFPKTLTKPMVGGEEFESPTSSV